ncbi:MAG: carboxypeptidase regulatory-like domain-containing protein [Pseudomonadota bacterium]
MMRWLGLAVALAAAGTAVAGGGSFSGNVTTDGGGTALEGVVVDLFRNDTGSFEPFDQVTTGPAGTYAFSGVPDGSYKVATYNQQGLVDEIADSPNVSCNLRECFFNIDIQGEVLDVVSGTGSFVRDFDLAAGDSLSGSVTDGVDPVEDVLVCVYSNLAFEVMVCATSDASGAYQTPGFSGSGGLRATAQPLARTGPARLLQPEVFTNGGGVFFSGANVDEGNGINVSGATTRNFVLNQGGVIAGRFEDEGTTAPLTEIFVDVFDEGGNTIYRSTPFDDLGDGTYVTAALPAGTYFLAGRRSPEASPLYVPNVFDGATGSYCAEGDCDLVVVDDGQAITVAVGAAATADFFLERGATISGAVFANPVAKGLDEVEGVVVCAFADDGEPLGACDVTDFDGNYTLPAMPLAVTRVLTETSEAALGLIPEAFGGTVALPADPLASDPVDLSGGNQSGIDFVLDPGAIFVGKVRDDETNAVLGGYFFEVYDLAGNFLTSSEGIPRPLDTPGYRTEGLPPGDYRVVVRAGPDLPYLSEVYVDTGTLFCQNLGDCDPLAGDPISVDIGSNLLNLDLTRGAQIIGRVDDAVAPGVGIDGAMIEIYDDMNMLVTTAAADATGVYGASVLPGTYFLQSAVAGYRNQVYDGQECATDDCGTFPPAGTTPDPIVVAEGDTAEMNDFVLVPTQFTLAGTVSDEDAMVPLAGAEVCLFDDLGVAVGSCAITDVDGAYAFTELAPADYFVSASAAGFDGEVFDDIACAAPCDPVANGGTPITVGVSTPAIDIALGPETFAISGEVGATALVKIDSPIEGAEVCLFDSVGDPVDVCMVTDPAGAYGFAGLAPGTYFVTATAAGFVGEVFDDVACDPACDPLAGAAVTLGPDAAVDFVLDPLLFTISGSVTNADVPGPVAGAEVCFFDSDGLQAGACATTDGAGAYDSGDLPAGTYFARASADGFSDLLFDGVPCASGCDVTAGTVIDIAAAAAMGVDFALTPGTFGLTGTVTTAAGGAPLPGAEVCLFDNGGGPLDLCATADGGGAYAFAGLSAGTYLAVAGAEGFSDQLFDGVDCQPDCSFGSGTPLTLGPSQAGVDFALAEAANGVIAGTVTLAGSDAGLEGIPVIVVDGTGVELGAVATAADGSYAVGELPAGDLFVFVDGDGRGFFSEIYDGGDGVACDAADCAGVAPVAGLPVAVVNDSTTPDIDFALDPGGDLTGVTVAELDQLGAAVALCGARAALGVPGDDEAAENAGAVLVYHRSGSGYTFFEKLLPSTDDPDGVAGLQYGFSLDCSGDTLLIGAPGGGVIAKGGSGGKPSAFVMQMAGDNSGFQQLQQLIGQNLGMGESGGAFGASVAVSGNTMAVGAPASDLATVLTLGGGASPWQQATVLSDPEAQQGAAFGSSVDVADNGLIAVGSPNQTDDNGLTSGVAQMFSDIAGTENWSQVGKITNTNPQPGDAFGTSVSLEGTTLAVGAPGDDDAGENAGSASVFSFDGGNFTLLGTLEPSDGVGGEAFGTAIDIAGGLVAVGAASGNGANVGSGAAYLYRDNGVSIEEIAKFFAANGATGDLFGASIAFDGETLLIGAPRGNVGGIETGRATAITSADTLFRDGYER